MAEPAFTDPIAYDAQPYLPNPPALPTAGRHLVYLDVWDREVTHLEQPDLVESAVNVETSSRLQTVWQVRVLDDDAGTGTTCATPDEDVPGWPAVIAPSTGVLTTGTFEVAPVDDPCELPPTGGYRGLENQLYRVEIHDPGQPGGRRHLQMVARERQRRQPRRQHDLGRRARARDPRPRRRAVVQDRRLGRDHRRPPRVRAGTPARCAGSPSPGRRAASSSPPALPADMLPGSFPDSAFPQARNLRVRRWDQAGQIFRTDASGTPVAGAGPRRAALDRRDRRARRHDDAAAGARRHRHLRHDRARGLPCRRLLGVCRAHRRRLGRAARPRRRRAASTTTSRASGSGMWVRAPSADCRHPWPPPAGEGHDCSCTACVTAEIHASGSFTIQDAVNQAGRDRRHRLHRPGPVCARASRCGSPAPGRCASAGRGRRPCSWPAAGAIAIAHSIGIAVENLAILRSPRGPAISVRNAIGPVAPPAGDRGCRRCRQAAPRPSRCKA